jgi:N-acyl-L-homoserine lactone synthetase
VAVGTRRQDPSPDRPLARTAPCGGLTGANHGTAAAEWRATRRRLASDTRPTLNPASSASMAPKSRSRAKSFHRSKALSVRYLTAKPSILNEHTKVGGIQEVYFNASAASSGAQQGNVTMEWTVLKADTQELRESAFHLRYKAYHAAGAVEATKSQLLTDKYDGQPNGFTYLLIKDHDLVGSIRALIYSSHYNRLPISSFETWEKDIIEKLGPNNTIVEASRFAMHPESVSPGLEAQSQLFQTIIANALKHNARYLIAATRTKHQAFYKRMLGFSPITTAINASEHYGFKMHGALLASDMALSYEHMSAKIPALRIGNEEVERYATPFLDETSHATQQRRGSSQLARLGESKSLMQ